MTEETKKMIFVGAAAVGSLMVGFLIAKLARKKPVDDQEKEDG